MQMDATSLVVGMEIRLGTASTRWTLPMATEITITGSVDMRLYLVEQAAELCDVWIQLLIKLIDEFLPRKINFVVTATWLIT